MTKMDDGLGFSECFSHPDWRSPHLLPIDPASLSACERVALTLDGTLTTFLTMLKGEIIKSEILPEQAEIAEETTAFQMMLMIGANEDSPAPPRLRRVLLRGASGAAYVAARSMFVESRAPVGFADALRHAPRGIGQALAMLKAEHARDLLWCGRGPGLDASAPGVLVRAYRLVYAGLPFAAIEEAFLLPL